LATGMSNLFNTASDSSCAAEPRYFPDSFSAVAQSIGMKLGIIALNAVTGILSARALQPAGRGELAAMILWPMFLASALTFGLPSAVTFRLRSTNEKENQLLGAALVLALASGGLGATIGWAFMSTWISQYSESVTWFARVFVWSTPFAALLLVGRAALESRGDFASSNKLLLASPLFTLLCLLGFWLAAALTPVTAAFSYVVVGILPLLWMLFRLRRLFHPSLVHFLDSSRLLFTYGLRAYGIDLCGTMSLYIDQALVVRMLEPQMMGAYVVALGVSRVLNAFHASVVMVLFPRAVNQPASVVQRMTGRAAGLSALLTGVAGVGIASLGPYVLGLVYGREYAGAGPVLRILVIEVVLSGTTLVLAQAFMALERPGVITALQLIGLLLTLPLMLVLVPRLGLVGAGLALLISTVARLIFVLISFPVFLRMPVPAILPGLDDLRLIGSSICQPARLFRGQPTVATQGAD
jgi:O-antigen/teichoic acid export membrane protein